MDFSHLNKKINRRKNNSKYFKMYLSNPKKDIPK